MSHNGDLSKGEYEFENWLKDVIDKVKATIFSNPEKYKPGSKTSTRFQFDETFWKISSDPMAYPDELRCRLSTTKRGEVTEVDSYFFTIDDNGQKIELDPSEITSGSYMIPIIKIGYRRNIDKFSLSFTVLAGQVYVNEYKRIMNSEWEIDTSMECDN
jgi:hypothetical protein